VNPQGEIIEYNRAAQELLQCPPNEILYRNVQTLLGTQTGFDLSTKRKGVDKITIQSPAGLNEYSLESIPFFDRTGTEIAILLKLEKLKKCKATPIITPANSNFLFRPNALKL
jgi:hypothetical protein